MNWKKFGVNAAFWTAVIGATYAVTAASDKRSEQELAEFAERFNDASFTVEGAQQLIIGEGFLNERKALNNCLSDQLPDRVSSSAYRGDAYVTTTTVPTHTIARGALQDCIKTENTHLSAPVLSGVGGAFLAWVLLNTPIPVPTRRRRNDDNKPKFGELPPASNLG